MRVILSKKEHRLRKKYCLSLILFTWFMSIFFNNSFAGTDDFQLWTSIVAQGPINKEYPKIKYWLDYQGRFGEDASKLSQLVLRPGIGFQLVPSTSIWLGYAWIHVDQPFVTRPSDENRSWQQILWTDKFNKFALTLRSRLEQRFIPQAIHTAWRYRQLFKIAVNVPNNERFTLIGSDEIFYHFNNFNRQNNSGLDQNRAFLGVGYKTSKESTLEIGYLNQNIRRANSEDYNGNCLYLGLVLNY